MVFRWAPMIFFTVLSLSLQASSAAVSDKKNTQPTPLTDQAGNAKRGKQWILSEEKGNCLLCHRIQSIKAPFQGTIGPDLSSVGRRLSPAELRFRIVDSTRLLPQTIMPAYYQSQGLTQVAKAYQNKTLLNAQEVEDIIAYLAQLTDKVFITDKVPNEP